jgi:hypothetical protein
MQKISFLLLIIMILASCVTEQSTPTHENVEETILALEGEALDQWSQGNPAGYPMHAADDITYLDDIGAQNRLVGKEALDAYAIELGGNIPPHTYEMVDPLVQVYGDIAILTFQYHSMIDTMAGTPWKATSVYHFNDSIWQMVHANWSLVKTE